MFHETIATVICATALTLCAVAPAGAETAVAPEPDPLLAPPGRCKGDDDPGAHHRTQRLAMHCLLDHLRRAAQVPHLRSSARLRHSATYKARRIAECKTFTHTPCGDRLAEPFSQAQVSAHGAWTVGEDLAWGVGPDATARSILQQWLSSPSHRAVLVDGQFTHVGLRRRRLRMQGAPVGAVLWVAHLGRPSSH